MCRPESGVGGISMVVEEVFQLGLMSFTHGGAMSQGAAKSLSLCETLRLSASAGKIWLDRKCGTRVDCSWSAISAVI